ncbi:MAG TPA: hypothetical protein VGS78_17305 [Candidatus Sulfotelmatobacter sp.]|nr:hypothetical protein [Candidatus Sulfotelmatobacter sp.]
MVVLFRREILRRRLWARRCVIADKNFRRCRMDMVCIEYLKVAPQSQQTL